MGDYYIAHHGIKGQKWGIRRYQNADGSYTSAGKARRAHMDRIAEGLNKDASRIKSNSEYGRRYRKWKKSNPRGNEAAFKDYVLSKTKYNPYNDSDYMRATKMYSDAGALNKSYSKMGAFGGGALSALTTGPAAGAAGYIISRNKGNGRLKSAAIGALSSAGAIEAGRLVGRHGAKRRQREVYNEYKNKYN